MVPPSPPVVCGVGGWGGVVFPFVVVGDWTGSPLPVLCSVVVGGLKMFLNGCRSETSRNYSLNYAKNDTLLEATSKMETCVSTAPARADKGRTLQKTLKTQRKCDLRTNTLQDVVNPPSTRGSVLHMKLCFHNLQRPKNCRYAPDPIPAILKSSMDLQVYFLTLLIII